MKAIKAMQALNTMKDQKSMKVMQRTDDKEATAMKTLQPMKATKAMKALKAMQTQCWGWLRGVNWTFPIAVVVLKKDERAERACACMWETGTKWRNKTLYNWRLWYDITF